MKLKCIIMIMITYTIQLECADENWDENNHPEIRVYPCNDTEDISISFTTGMSINEENQYLVKINKFLPKHTQINLEFESDARVMLINSEYATLTSSDKTNFFINIIKSYGKFTFKVKGTTTGVIPYFEGIRINSEEFCSRPYVGYLDDLISDNENENTGLDDSCGQRKVYSTELIVNGVETKPGDWPWHAAIYKHDRSVRNYICGGTLISKIMVLTAAHCASNRGLPVLPELLSVVLGKFNFIGGDLAAQEREVLKVIVHDDFDRKELDNDIALLKLKLNAVYNNYIQPACLWDNEKVKGLISHEVIGTVIGWGLDETNSLSPQLRKATFPIVPDITCIRSHPLFYSTVLNGKKFCAGDQYGTSPCNGDSGGGYHVFIPQDPRAPSSHASGSWYVRGIVSTTISKTSSTYCNPYYTAVFTDVARYHSWVLTYV